MIERWIDWLYRHFGRRYGYLIFAAALSSQCGVAAVAVGIVSTFFEPPLADVALVAGVAVVLTAVAISVSALATRAGMRTIRRWQDLPFATRGETVAAWEVASTLTMRQFQRSAVAVNLGVIVPAAACAALVWDIGWAGFGAIILGGAIPGAYATVLGFSVFETMRRPLVAEIAAHLPDEFEFAPRGVSVHQRLRISIPVYITGTAVTVVGVVTSGGGARALSLTVLVALGVGLFMSYELTSLLSRNISGPITRVRRALAQVHAGDYQARALVLSSDELGGLTHDFNLMARGLAEREDLRSAFGTYVDKEAVRLILSGELPREGFEVEASILFCDIRGFTTYAEQANASEVIATLNQVFTAIVPVVESFGGHVDKFLGDGLLAMFGTPEPYPDHADRAVAAAQMLVDVVAQGPTGLRMAAGVNTGRLVVGPLGGGGRFNFSVIGDAVNVAARVEAATRQTGDDVLLTADTLAQCHDPSAFVSRGKIELKGKSTPVEVFAPASVSGASE